MPEQNEPPGKTLIDPLRSRAAAVFAAPETYATCLIALGLDRFGSECLSWTPETWLHEVESEFGVELSRRNLDRLAGALVLLTRPDEFYQSTSGFNDITQAIAGDWFDPDVWHPPTTAECLWAAVESYLLDPPDTDESPEEQRAPRFSVEIAALVNAIARKEGFRSLPREFGAFGIPNDPSAEPPDYTSDPVLFEASEAGAQAHTEELSAWLTDRMLDLAHHLRDLPVKSGMGDRVAADIEAAVPRPARASEPVA